MSQIEIVSKVQELQELRRMQDELNAEIEALQDAIKAHMTEINTDQIIAGAFKVSWKEVTSNRIDTSAMKKAVPEIVAQFTKSTVARRFTVQ